ncbi:MAG: TIGR02281 family clan AA aspartic protease [Gammaproteobacteria bacterium]|nr:TIGR02281 family clan AA aspartic protease [Gammaproteobacteria bacterium]
MLQQSKYEQAIELYNQAYSSSDAVLAKTLRGQIFSYADNLIGNKKYDSAASLLTVYSAAFIQDVAALSYLAKVQNTLTQTNKEIETLYQALSLEHREQQRQDLRRRLNLAVTAQAFVIKSQQGDHAVVAFYEALNQRDPNHSLYIVKLAEAYLITDRYQEALHILSNNALDEKWQIAGNHLRAAAEKLRDSQDSTPLTIPLIPYGNGFAINATVDGRYAIRLLIDTGATMTVIRPSLADLINAPTPQHSTVFQTANGSVRAPIIKLDSLSLGDAQVKDLEVAVMPLPELGNFDGLLGMNYLRHYRFTLSQKERLLYLTK